jgi:hypothetical protein
MDAMPEEVSAEQRPVLRMDVLAREAEARGATAVPA